MSEVHHFNDCMPQKGVRHVFLVGSAEAHEVQYIGAEWFHCFDPLDYQLAHPGRCTIVNKAVSNTTGVPVKFYELVVREGSSLFKPKNIPDIYVSQFRIAEFHIVETITLDDYVSENKLDGLVDMIIIDAQGAEPQVLEGASKLLGSVSLVLVETLSDDTYRCGPTRQKIIDIMTEHGFEIAKEMYLHPPSMLASDIMFRNMRL